MTTKALIAKMQRRIDRKEKELKAEKEAYAYLIQKHAEELQQMKDDLKRFKKAGFHKRNPQVFPGAL